MPDQPGRSCPVHYHYAPTVFATPAAVTCEVLYVVGGVYGNPLALDAVFTAFAAESGATYLIFNGDFNWFNVDPALFQYVNERVLAWPATRGNVETELGAAGSTAGCGCAYPAWVDDGTVARSNAIMHRLQQTAAQWPALQARLRALPMWQRIDVGATRVAVVHGDAESLAGWGFAQETLREAAHLAQVRHWFGQAQVASSPVPTRACRSTSGWRYRALPKSSPIMARRGCPTSRARSMACSRASPHAPMRAPSAVGGARRRRLHRRSRPPLPSGGLGTVLSRAMARR